MPIMLFLILILIFVVLLVVVTNIVIVPQSMVYVVERLGSYSETWSAGLHVKIPFLERVAKKVSLKEQVADFPPQPVITRDNVTMQIDTVVFFQVMDAKLYTYGVNQPIAAIESLSATTLRNIIGEMELDHTLTSRDTINSKITAILDEATDKWGIKVNRVEVKNIIPPREIQEAMEKQMKAEREKRAVILKADGEKQAAITAAEGEKESAILRADAVKQQRILEAEGEAQAIPCTETTMNVNGQDCEALSYTLTGDDGQTSTVSYCLVGDDLKYVVTDAAEGRTIVEYRVTSTSVDQNLFIIPADYQIMTQEELAAQMGQ